MSKCESCYFLTWYLAYLLSLQQYEKHWYRNGEVYTGEIHMHGNNALFPDGFGNIIEWR